MQKPFSVLAAVVTVAWCSYACAIVPVPPPPYPIISASVYVNPAGPSATQSIQVFIFDRYSAGEFDLLEPLASAKTIAWRIEGNTIYVTAELFDPGRSPQPRLVVSIPSLPDGHYTIVYDGSTNLTHPEAHKATREFVVSANNIITVIEFYNAQLGHYFITADVGEIAKLDQGTIRGWVRTGETFRTYSAEAASIAQLPTVCRFYGLPSAGIDSHFFSSTTSECTKVSNQWPDAWLLETRAAFGGTIDLLTATIDTTCGDAGQPLYRLYNNRADANHRYTVSRTTRDQMLAQGWLLEGPQWDFRPEVPGDVRQFEMCVFR